MTRGIGSDPSPSGDICTHEEQSLFQKGKFLIWSSPGLPLSLQNNLSTKESVIFIIYYFLFAWVDIEISLSPFLFCKRLCVILTRHCVGKGRMMTNGNMIFLTTATCKFQVRLMKIYFFHLNCTLCLYTFLFSVLWSWL